MTKGNERKPAPETVATPAATRSSRQMKPLLFGVGLLCLGGLIGASANATLSDTSRLTDEAQSRIEAAFPNSTFDRIKYDETSGLITAESGSTILYFTTDGKIALVGNLLDLENKVDLTAERQGELQAASALEARAFGKPIPRPSAAAGSQGAQPAAPAPQRPPTPQNVDVSNIPDANVVVHNPGASKVVYVVSDYNCSFCRLLHKEMDGLDIEVREIPVAFQGQDSGIKGSAALCAEDPQSMAAGFYNGTGGTRISTCTEGDSAVQENTAWANQIGITGTPFIILPGDETQPTRTNSGYMDLQRLLPFLGLTS